MGNCADYSFIAARKRRLLAGAAAAGVSVAFGSPLGGVLFGLEELDAFFDDGDVMWRGFVTSVIAAVSLQYIDPFGTAKLVLFQVTESRGVWRAFELVRYLAVCMERDKTSFLIDPLGFPLYHWGTYPYFTDFLGPVQLSP